MFNAEFTAVIQTLVAEQGKAALVDPAKCKAFLPDYAKNEYVKDRRLLQRVVEAGVAKEIDTATNLDICKKQQVRHLKEELFMAEDVAASAVDLLAFVLRGDTGRTTLEAPKPAPQKPEEVPVAAAEPQNLPAPEPVPQKPVTPLPELKPFFENVPQPAPAVTPKPDESKDAKSKYKHSLGYRVLRTGILAVLGIGLWTMKTLSFYDIIITLFMSGIFLDGIWTKPEYKRSLGYRILWTGILAVLDIVFIVLWEAVWVSLLVRHLIFGVYIISGIVPALFIIVGIFLDGIWIKSEYKHSLGYRILWTSILAVLGIGTSWPSAMAHYYGDLWFMTTISVLFIFIFCIFLDGIWTKSEYKRSLRYRILWTGILAVPCVPCIGFIISYFSYPANSVGSELVLFIIFCVFWGEIWAKEEK
jgi:hypothetical protein